MRIGLFSDIHSNFDALETVIEALRRDKVDRFFCIGDLVGYGPEPERVIEKVREIGTVTIAGNHDYAVGGILPMDDFNRIAQVSALWTRERLDQADIRFLRGLDDRVIEDSFEMVHGSPRDPSEEYLTMPEAAEECFGLLDRNLCFVGHTHVPAVFFTDGEGVTEKRHLEDGEHLDVSGGPMIVNVGSVGQPRDGDPRAAFGVLDLDSSVLEFHRIAYQVEMTRKKILRANLPEFLADRLKMGR